jgi:hypothetical protein
MLESSARRPVAAAFAVAMALVLAGCATEKSATPAPSPTPIASLDTAAIQIPRIEFCRLVPSAAVTDALGGKAVSGAAYGNGDEVVLPGVGTDVVHEIGCSWTGTGESSARAWVFARPVSRGFAQDVVSSSTKAKGCRVVAGAPYGEPSMLQVCTLRTGHVRIRHAGLFGQTWLTCEISASGVVQADLLTRTDRWCVKVANALDTAG